MIMSPWILSLQETSWQRILVPIGRPSPAGKHVLSEQRIDGSSGKKPDAKTLHRTLPRTAIGSQGCDHFVTLDKTLTPPTVCLPSNLPELSR